MSIVERIKKKLGVFDHKKAQEYEISSAYEWMDDNCPRWFGELDEIRAKGRINVKKNDPEIFGSREDFVKCHEHIRGKVVMDIGCGPCGGNAGSYYQASKRVLIDPLANDYRNYQVKKFGRSLLDDEAVIYSQPAEKFIPEMEGKVDGMIICRNTLDHCKKPFKILDNIARYAAPGCYFFVWTDLYHVAGHDDGHSHITKDVASFERYILETMGFSQVVHRYEMPDRNTLNLGLTTIKTR